MKIDEIYKLAIKMGVDADFRGNNKVKKILEERKNKFSKFSEEQKKYFDKETLQNPYSDTRILNIKDDKPIKKILVGIDIDVPELLIGRELGVDLVISHHPLGSAYWSLHEVMDLQADVLASYGVPINVAEKLIEPRSSEVFRSVSPRNSNRVVDAAKILGVNLMCAHTACDNLAANFLKAKIEGKNFERVKDLLKEIESISEYQTAKHQKQGPALFAGKKDNYCGKIALTEITGGTEGSPKVYEWLAKAGIGTIIAMHVSEVHREQAEKNFLNILVAGHMSSDSLGVNLFLDELEKQGIEIIPCSGLIRDSKK
jgi:putative NIF3 family GTP cyclohydrolase 1 type 2